MTSWHIAKQDFRRQFGGAFAWLALAALLVLLAWSWLGRVDEFLHLQQSEQAPGSVTRALVLPTLASLAPLLLVLIGLLSLRGLNEDRRLGTLALLRTAPIGGSRVVLGKWLGLLSVPFCVIALVAIMLAGLVVGTELDLGRVAAGLIGLLLLVLAATAIGTAVSAQLRQPVMVALLSWALLFALWFIDLAPLGRGVVDSPLNYASLAAHFRPFLAGVVRSSGLVFYLSLTIAALCWARAALLERGVLHKTVVGLLGIAAVLALTAVAHRFDHKADWTATGSNSLSEVSQRLLETLEGPVEVTVFASQTPRLRRTIGNFLQRFAEHKPDWSIAFVDPAADPEQTRQLNVRADGEVRVRHAGGQEVLLNLSEQSLTNALFRLARQGDFFVGYSYGSGERDLRGVADFDLGTFGQLLAERGVQVTPVDLVLNPRVPENLDLIIVSQPRADLLPGVAQSLRQHVQLGGNLLWLADPGALHGLETLLDELRIEALPGTLVDAAAPGRGQDPYAPVISNYSDHPLVREFSMQTIFPRARAWRADRSNWEVSPLLRSGTNSWNETGDLLGEIGFDSTADEQRGPLPLALALTRKVADEQQRVVVVGDGDFLSNRFLGNGGNLDLGLQMVDWLLAEDRFIEIPARLDLDRRLELSANQSGGLGLIWLILIPGLLVLVGAWRWWLLRHA